MREVVWLAVALAVLAFFACRAARIWIDARHLGFAWAPRLGWSLRGALVSHLYWWGARIDALPPVEQARLLDSETAAMGLSRADSQRCPLCGAEIPRAWALANSGQPAIAPGPIECPGCDFRLDACRHCAHFLPGSPGGWASQPWSVADMTSGRCSHYKSSQPVELACAPGMARQLTARGYETIRAPRPIMDSFLPPDSCRAFRPDRKRLQASSVSWPDTRRAAMLRLLAPPQLRKEPLAGELTAGEEQWLL